MSNSCDCTHIFLLLLVFLKRKHSKIFIGHRDSHSVRNNAAKNGSEDETVDY